MAPPITLLKMVRCEDVIDDVTVLKSFENHENMYILKMIFLFRY